MRSLKIIQHHGPKGQVVVETSAGVRAAGATVQSALQKLDLTGFSAQSDYDAVAKVFERIHDSEGPTNIGRGVASA